MKKLLPVLLLTAFLINSCEDEEFRTITITHHATITLYEGSRWVFIADSNGTPLDFAKLPDDGSVVLHIPGSVNDESVTLNYFTTETFVEAKVNNLMSFAEVQPGNYMISNEQLFTAAEHAEVTLQNLPPATVLGFSGQAFYMGFSGETFMLNIFPGSNSEAKTLVSVLDNETSEGKYHFFNIKADDQLTLDFNTFSEFEQSEISVTGDAASVTQHAYANDVKFHIGAKTFFLTGAATQIPLYRAPNFDSYLTSITVTDGAEVHANIFNSTDLPSTFVKLNANAELVTNDQSGFTFNTTGESDLARVVFTHESTNQWGPKTINTRTCYLPPNSVASFRHPNVPAEILQSIGTENFPVGNLDQISLIDYDNFGGYDDYIRERFDGRRQFYLEVESGAKWKTKGF